MHASANADHIIAQLTVFFGDNARSLFEANDCSLLRLFGSVRRAQDCPMCQPLQAAIELVMAALREELKSTPAMTAPQVVADFLKLHFAGQQYESFAVLYLDARGQLIAAEDLFRGTLTQTAVYPREVVRQALHHNCASVILAHVHPSGVCEPSHADEALTDVLKRALALVDIRVLDHFIIAGSSALSFAEQGRL